MSFIGNEQEGHMGSENLAVFFPGIGYTIDRPLLHYASRMMQSYGYERIFINYGQIPVRIKPGSDKVKEAFLPAYDRVCEQLSDVDFEKYRDILFIGKSIGTIISAKYAKEHGLDIKHIWYTPLIETFSFDTKRALAFIGDDDPWSDVDKVRAVANDMGIVMHSYPKGNHSLETGDVITDIDIAKDVMKKTDMYIRGDR